ncbi:zinc D-Ala-D-Ala carboxypeptidase [Azospirillaceae bacterium]
MADSNEHLNRRRFLRMALAAAGGALSVASLPEALAGPVTQPLLRLKPLRQLTFYNTHTSERLSVEYGGDGYYVPEAMRAVNKILRDHHDGTISAIDPKLLDALFAIRQLLGGNGVIHILSGYRSPRTNAALRMMYDGVAEHSLHMKGKAIDFWIPGRSLSDLHRAAMAVKAGGVGNYPSSGFIHVDVGPVRSWGAGGGGGKSAGFRLARGQGMGIPRFRNGLTPWQQHNLAMNRKRLMFDLKNRKRLRS